MKKLIILAIASISLLGCATVSQAPVTQASVSQGNENFFGKITWVGNRYSINLNYRDAAITGTMTSELAVLGKFNIKLQMGPNSLVGSVLFDITKDTYAFKYGDVEIKGDNTHDFGSEIYDFTMDTDKFSGSVSVGAGNSNYDLKNAEGTITGIKSATIRGSDYNIQWGGKQLLGMKYLRPNEIAYNIYMADFTDSEIIQFLFTEFQQIFAKIKREAKNPM